MSWLIRDFDWRSASWSSRFAYFFNRTALGLGVLLLGYYLWHQVWWRVGQILFMMALYFYLHVKFDAPGDP